MRYISLPDTNRFVTANLPYLDIALNSGWSGGNEATYTQHNSNFIKLWNYN